jgi:hypothetical protein
MESVNYNDKEFTEILLEIEDILNEAEKAPFQSTKDFVISLSKYLDLLHREPLTRLMNVINKNHPELKSQMESDYTITTILKLYDLIEGDVEKSPKVNQAGFIPDDQVGLFPPIVKTKKKG